jgi:Domain of unknown function (DUF3560)
MNEYEERQQAKKERLQAAAARTAEKADRLSQEGWESLRQIPFGQPILVGHHSEKSDRAYRGRAVGKIDRSVELSKHADELAARAEAVGTGGISSDDPEAIQKLEAKLLEKQEAHAFMVQKNKEARSLGQTRPFMAYQLSNSNNNIRSIKQRIEQLQRMASAPKAEPIEGSGWKMTEDAEENRIVLKFTEKPNEERRTLLRSYAFLWSPIRGAWVRKITPNARYAAKILATKLAA